MIPILVPDLPTTEQLIPWLQRIDNNKWYSNFGPLVQEFESKLKQLLSQPIELITVSSGTTALELALLALNLPVGSKVLLPALTFPATATAIKRADLQPIFTDVDPHTWHLGPSIAHQVHKKLAYDVVMPVATFGCPQPAAEWDKFAEETGITVLLDAAAAFGSQTVGNRCIITFSFHATKPFSIGEGGLIVANSPVFIQQLKKLSNFGFENGIIVQSGGSNAKLSEYHAAVGLAQLSRWQNIVERRQYLWNYYTQHLQTIGEHINLQPTPKNHIPAILPIKLLSSKRSPLIEYLTQQGIETRCWYCPPLHEHLVFSDISIVAPNGSKQLPVSEELGKSLLGLPFHTTLDENQITYICSSLLKYFKG